jgi:hypothetical protein
MSRDAQLAVGPPRNTQSPSHRRVIHPAGPGGSGPAGTFRSAAIAPPLASVDWRDGRKSGTWLSKTGFPRTWIWTGEIRQKNTEQLACKASIGSLGLGSDDIAPRRNAQFLWPIIDATWRMAYASLPRSRDLPLIVSGHEHLAPGQTIAKPGVHSLQCITGAVDCRNPSRLLTANRVQNPPREGALIEDCL